MPRPINAAVIAAMLTGTVSPAFFIQIEWNGSTLYLWSGTGPYTIAGQTYLGMGNLGSISQVAEANSIVAQGVTLTLSGIDPVTLQDALTQLNHSLWAYVYLGFFGPGGLIGVPILAFAGLTDQTTVTVGAETATITLSLESRLSDLQRSQGRRYTHQDQQRQFPGDNSFSFVEKEIDMQTFWGSN